MIFNIFPFLYRYSYLLHRHGENATVKAETSEKPTTIVLTEPEKTAEAKTSKPEVSKPRSNVAVKNSVSEKQKAPAKPEHKNTAKNAKTEQNKSVSAKPSVKEPEIVQYWVQVTALTSRKSADEARNKLGENQITADVFTYTDNKKQLFLETLDEINTVARTAKQEKEEKFIATVACKAAVKANMALTTQEVEILMEKLLKLPNPFTCPHGRPTAIKMTKYDIERKFARK